MLESPERNKSIIRLIDWIFKIIRLKKSFNDSIISTGFIYTYLTIASPPFLAN